jgi:hypothetical protein
MVNAMETIERIIYTVSAIYSTATLVFEKNGTIVYTAESREVGDAHKESSTANISVIDFTLLTELIKKNGFLDLENHYTTPSLSDGDTRCITVFFGHNKKSVCCYGSGPEAFWVVEEKIVKLWNKPLLHVGF